MAKAAGVMGNDSRETLMTNSFAIDLFDEHQVEALNEVSSQTYRWIEL
jgi:penicillin-binding protein-related factor A (putative recombinase)